MKTVTIIGQTLNKNYAHKISGGIQTVERLHVQIFLSLGWEVKFIAPSCSEIFNQDPRFQLCLLTSPSEEIVTLGGKVLTRSEKGNLNRAKTVEMRDWLNEIQPDLIINHSFSSSHVRLAADMAERYPVLCFIHNTPDTAMDIAVISKVQQYLKLTQRGGHLVCVSDFQRDLWRKAIRKRHLGGESFDFIKDEEINKVYDKFVYPVFVPEVELSDKTGDHFICISRPDPIKNVHRLLELLALSPLPITLDLFLAEPGKLEDVEYYTKKMAPALEAARKHHRITVHQNAPRSDLLANLQQARGCFIPCPVEAAPVALLEAANYGVPSIVFGKKRDGVNGHAAVNLLGRSAVMLIDVSGTDQEASAALTNGIGLTWHSVNNRRSLSEHTQKLHSFAERTRNISELTAFVMAKYTKPKPLLSM